MAEKWHSWGNIAYVGGAIGLLASLIVIIWGVTNYGTAVALNLLGTWNLIYYCGGVALGMFGIFSLFMGYYCHTKAKDIESTAGEG